MVRKLVLVFLAEFASYCAVALLQDPFHSKTYDPFNQNPTQWDIDRARRTAQNESQLVSQERSRRLDSGTSREWLDSENREREHQSHQWQAERDARMLEERMRQNEEESRRRWAWEQEQRERSRRQQEWFNCGNKNWGVQHELERRQGLDKRMGWGGQPIETVQQRRKRISDTIASLEEEEKRARRATRYKGSISSLERAAIAKEDDARRAIIAHLKSKQRQEEQAERDAKGRALQSRNARLYKPRRKGGGR